MKSKPKKRKQRTKQQQRERRRREARTDRDQGQRAKMSAILSDLGRPWIERLGADPDLGWVNVIYNACALAWNASRIQDPAERSAAFAKATRQVVEPAEEEIRGEIAMMMERTCRRADGWLPEERRNIVSLSVKKSGPGQIYLTVAGIGME